MVRITYFLSLALAAHGLHAAPTVSGAQGDLQTRQARLGGGGGRAGADAAAGGIAKAPAPNNGGFPSPEFEGQRQGNRGSTTFKDTPEGKAAIAAQAAAASRAAAASERAAAVANAGANAEAAEAAKKAAGAAQAGSIANAPRPNSGAFPSPEFEGQRQGNRGSTTFRNTPEGRVGN